MSVTPPPGPPNPFDPLGDAPGPVQAKQRGPVLLGVVIGVLVFALVAGGFVAWRVVEDHRDGSAPAAAGPSISATPSAEGPLPATDPALARFYDQKLAWTDCDGGECAELTVPLDYAEPEATVIELALLRVPASSEEKRIGSLVVNPGGPGASGVEFAAAGSSQFGSTLTTYYDIVGFDPRGVGKSATLDCATTEQLDALFSYDPSPDDAAERAEIDRRIAVVGQGCVSRSGDVVRHISTKEAARDMDVLRAALGQVKLDYLGSSYGTFLGATYAEAFPQNVGRFVLDGAVDPSLSTVNLSLQQARGFETALRAYVADCVERGDCFLGGTVDAGTQRIRAFLDDLDRDPLPTSGPRELTEGVGILGIFLPLYVKSLWPSLTQALRQGINDGNGTALLFLADFYTSRGAEGYDDNSMEALYAVNCLDHNDFIETEEVPQYFPQFDEASPTFGRAFAYSLSTCAQWPVKTGDRTVALTAKGAPPIIVVGTTRDPATPLIWSQAMAKQLESGRLITRDGDGHTGFQKGNDCVDDAVEGWLVSGTVPKPDLKC